MNYSHHGNIVFAWSKQDIPAMGMHAEPEVNNCMFRL